MDISASGVLVQGNFIGTNAAGNAALGNSQGGVEVGRSNNTIGGTASAARNLISGNSEGVVIGVGWSGVQMQGNYIGTDITGNNAVGNGYGVDDGGNNNTIGGTTPGAGNLISGNTVDGVRLAIGSGGQVLGNSIGTNAAGTAAVFNRIGVEVAGTSNTIGGSVSGVRNIISGNSGDGVLIDNGASGNLVGGNILGLNASGSTALGNSGNGLEVQGTNNTIGGGTFAARNYISGNSKDGLLLGSSASGNLVLDAFIGLNTSGTVSAGNVLNGVEIAGSSNTLGSTISGGFNFISGSGSDGVLIDSTAKNTLVQSNDIGTDYTGQKGIGNGSIGLEVAGVGTTIGGTVSGARNIVSANKGDGVKLDTTGSGTVLLGNSIGVSSINKALGNSGNGLNILSNGNTVGGTATTALNLISGNSKDGVLIGSGASGNQLLNFFIGTDQTSSAALANSANGIEIAGTGNTIGRTTGAATNIISGNSNDGILLDSTASGNLILGNYIGLNHAGSAAVANKVGIEDAGTSNTIGGSVSGARNYISGNSGDGVLIDSTSSSDLIGGNFLGLNPNGTAALANGANGIESQGSKSTIGGTVLAARNYISANKNDGLLLGSSASSNLILDNFIGVDQSGTHGVGNVNYGISLAGSNNTLGGTTSAYTNVISGSSKDGILLAATASGNLIQGNVVGTAYNGQTSVANGIGIEIAGTNNTLGGTAAGARNIVSGNTGDGVLLDSGGNGTLLLGNWIGVSAINKALANSGNGVDVAGNNNTIGGTASGARNVLSGNSKDGLLIASGASGNQVIGNYIGTDIYTLAALSNGSNGVEIGGSGNAIGGTASAAKNLISGNSGDGVKIDSGASGNQVLGNYIGTSLNGLSALGNGTGIEDGGSSNTLGGSVSGARNVISGNTGDAILLDSTASGDAVWQNYIGIIASTGNAGLANGKNGVEVQGDNNTIGGTVFFQRNYISDSGNDGVFLTSSASGNLLLNNFIGIGVNGTTGISNITGIEIAGTGNTIGGTVAGSTNVISANKSDGILIDSSGSGNLVLGNNVGPDYTGNGAGVANSGNGIEIAGTGNTLGGTTSAAKNIISGNSGDGVLLDSTGSGNVVLGNNIGVGRSGATLANSGNGVEIAGSKNTVGGATSGARNVISGNVGDGVLLSATASTTLVEGNYIGLNSAGTAALGNGEEGIEDAGSAATIGGTASGAGNVICGNVGDGVLIDSGASGEALLGNTIGLNAAGTASLFVGTNGVEVAASNNTIGGTATGSRNVISGNLRAGILLDSTGAGNLIQGNYIGPDSSGKIALLGNTSGIEVGGNNNTISGGNVISGNGGDGVLIDSTASGELLLGNYIGLTAAGSSALSNAEIGLQVAGSSNTIGGTNAGDTNVISGNIHSSGVRLDSTGAGNLIQGNYIGTDSTGKNAVGNGTNGILLFGNNNMIGGSVAGAGNTIANNGGVGVPVDSGSGNTISQNSIYANASGGISLSLGANNDIAAPSLTSASISGTTLTVQGTFNAPTASVSYVLEFFANPTSDAEGKIYLGSLTVTPSTTGTQNFTFTTTTSVTGTDPVITATLTDNVGDTSEFSNGVTVTTGPTPPAAIGTAPLSAADRILATFTPQPSDAANAYQSEPSSVAAMWQSADALALQRLDALLSMEAGAMGITKDNLMRGLLFATMASSNG